MNKPTAPRRDWSAILRRSVEILGAYDTGVTLRQLFYRLVAEGALANTWPSYKALSRETAKARREGWFPDLEDRTREIHEYESFASPEAAEEWLRNVYRRDRTEGQAFSVYIGVEKHGLVNQLSSWFSDLGIPILSLGGYSSQTYVDEVAAHVSHTARSAVLLYAGDFDPSGEDIDRDFVERCGCFDKVVRVALTAEQVLAFDLPPAMGKADDSRASAFLARHGVLVQVELDALPPDALRGLFQDALDPYWDMSQYEAALQQEEADRESL